MGLNYKTIFKKGKFGRNLLPNEGIKLRVVDKLDEDATILVLFLQTRECKKENAAKTLEEMKITWNILKEVDVEQCGYDYKHPEKR